MNRDKANQLLGGPHATPEAVKAAFAVAVRANHPDTSVDPGTGVPMSQLQEARDVLIRAIADGLNQVQEIACKMCGGSGRVGIGFGAPCAACQGTGHQR